MTRQQFLARALPELHRFFEEEGVWHCLAFGTLLGAVRDGSVIAWDHDLDLFVRPADVARLLAHGGHHGDFHFAPYRIRARSLAIGSGQVAMVEPGAVMVSWEGRTLGELWAPKLFADGVLRLYDLDSEVYFWPQSSFPHFALAETATVTLDERPYPAPRDPERWLEWTYGPMWHVPYQARSDGGGARPGFGLSGDAVTPALAERIAQCRAEGWDTRVYAGQIPWPRKLRGGGPSGGGTPRAAETSGSDWWHDLDELVSRY